MRRGRFVRGLIRELAQARGDISVGGFMNCHAIGLHSIVLRERPMVRMFVTTRDHDLWGTDDGVPATLAFHSHRTDLTLETVAGAFFNWMLTFDNPSTRSVTLNAFTWDSKINGGAGSFTRRRGRSSTGFVVAHRIADGAMATMAARELHTVEVERGERAAWLVTEGREDPGYTPVSWSTRNLVAFDPTGLYRPMTQNEASDLLSWVLADAAPPSTASGGNATGEEGRPTDTPGQQPQRRLLPDDDS